MSIVRMKHHDTSTALLTNHFKKGDASESAYQNGRRIAHYVEFQTAIIKAIESLPRKNRKQSFAFKKLVTMGDLFTQMLDHEYELCVNWPHREGSRPIVIIASSHRPSINQYGEFSFKFYYQNKPFLMITLHHNNEMTIENTCPFRMNKLWSDADVNEIADHFFELFLVKKCTYIKPKQEDQALIKKRLGGNSFDKEIFENEINQCNAYTVTSRIQQCIINNAVKRYNDFTFYLNWPTEDSQPHRLKAIFTRGDLFSNYYNDENHYSWFISEDALLEHFPEYEKYDVKTGQYYYSLHVYEVLKEDNNKHETELLSLWMTHDAMFGELRDVHKGHNLTGNDVLNIYKCFDELFKIKTTFLCDESKLTNEDESINIPLRLILAISTGKTWYQSKLPGLTLFECNNFQTIADGVISQSSLQREKAIRDLSKLRISKWYDMLNDDNKIILKRLYDNHLKESETPLRRSERINTSLTIEMNQVIYTRSTLKDLIVSIYDESKIQRTITPDLTALVRLLCEGTYLVKGKDSFTESDADFWVKFRVNILLEQSRFWVKTRMDGDESHPQSAHLNQLGC